MSKNPIYTGQIAHKGQLYSGQHPALIDAETWIAVRDRLVANAGDHRRKARAEPSLLAGLLFDARGKRLTPSHAPKTAGDIDTTSRLQPTLVRKT